MIDINWILFKKISDLDGLEQRRDCGVVLSSLWWTSEFYPQ